MIMETDIRVGNLLGYFNLYMAEEVFRVEGILEGFVYNSGLPRSKLPFSKVNPLELDADQLLQFGFVQGDRTYGEEESIYSFRYDRQNSIYIRDEGYSFCLLAPADGKWIPYGRRVVHVHQLQNVFYDLTGEELG